MIRFLAKFPALITLAAIASSLLLSACNESANGVAGVSLPAADSAGLTNGGNISNPTPVPVATPVPAAQFHSCQEVLTADSSSSDGDYALSLDNSGQTTTVFCDMTTDGGGWTTILDGANADRAALNYFFDNTSTSDLPDNQITRDPVKGIFWTSTQYLIAKNMPTNTEFRVIFSDSYTDPTFGTDCNAILGFASPNGYQSSDPTSFTAFIQKNDDSDYVKSTFDATDASAYQDVELNTGNKFESPMVNGSRIIAGNPYGVGYGNTCTTFFFKRIMVR